MCGIDCNATLFLFRCPCQYLRTSERNRHRQVLERTMVIAAVNVVLPWSTWPIVPILTCGLVLSKVSLAIFVRAPLKVYYCRGYKCSFCKTTHSGFCRVSKRFSVWHLRLTKLCARLWEVRKLPQFRTLHNYSTITKLRFADETMSSITLVGTSL